MRYFHFLVWKSLHLYLNFTIFFFKSKQVDIASDSCLTGQVTSHYLNQRSPWFLAHVCVIGPNKAIDLIKFISRLQPRRLQTHRLHHRVEQTEVNIGGQRSPAVGTPLWTPVSIAVHRPHREPTAYVNRTCCDVTEKWASPRFWWRHGRNCIGKFKSAR